MATEVSSSARDLQPYSCIGLIWVTFPDGYQARGTCSLVGRNDILTATHVIYSPDHGGWAENFDCYFGADYNDITNEFEDYGYSYSPDNWDINGWPNQSFTDSNNGTMLQSESQYDVAIIGVNNPIGDTLGWLGLDAGYDGSNSAIAVGYPAGATGVMKETVPVNENRYYGIYESNYDVLGPGSSGGPLLIGDYVIGVKSTGTWWADIGFTYDQIIVFMNDNDNLTQSPDTTAPIVSSFNPRDSATGVSTTANIEITFNEAIQRGAGNIILKTSAGTTIETFNAGTSSRLSISGSTLTIDPTSILANSTKYLITFGSGTIKDLAGNGYVGTTTYDFTTVADTNAPIISSLSPMDGAIDIPTTTDIVLTFNESIQRGTGTITLKTADGIIVESFNAASSENLSISGSALTIDPANILAYDTLYSLAFTSGTIKDLAGNGYTGNTIVEFTTAAETDPPVALSFSPSDEATGVATTANILVTFNETIHRGTGSIIIKTAAGTTVESFDAATSNNLSISDSILAINPSSILANGTKYFVTFELGTIKDVAGNAYAGTIDYDFFTVTSDLKGLAGFDKAYYLNVKLAALQNDPGTFQSWTGKSTAYLESVLTGAGFTAESHYMAYGYQEGLAPNAYFNPTEYKLAKATDMLTFGGYGSISAAEEVLESAWPYDFYQHYLQYGSKEGINPSNSFDESSYYDAKLASLQANPLAGWVGKTSVDLKALFDSLNITPLQHYLMYGANEGIAVNSVPAGERVGSAAIANSMGINQAEINLVGVAISPEPEVGY